MQVLPGRTRPADEPLTRRHSPRPARYRNYRSCLRWEFGFSCAFCLLHESDFAEHGIGPELFWIEHHALRSARPDLVDDYENCFYACKWCNQARASKPVRNRDGRRLLHPCEVAWSERFAVRDDRLPPLDPADPDAAYTHAAYDLDSLRKQRLRADRADSLDRAWEMTRVVPGRLDALRELAARLDGADRVTALTLCADLARLAADARRRLRRYAVVPGNAPGSCRCEDPPDLALPGFLAGQVTDAGGGLPP